MGRLQIHVIPHGESDILYFVDSMRFQIVDHKQTPVYLSAADGTPIDRLMSDYGLNERQCCHIYEILEEEERQSFLLSPDNKTDDITFSTLILNLSNDCNMKCGYCFANHGRYCSKKGMMTQETAIQAVNRFASQFQTIREIKFFGGEPLLNPVVLDKCCSHVLELVDKGRLNQRPRLKVISNGTMLDDQIIQIIKQYDLNIVFSVDGPPEIHDQLRVYRDGRASFADIEANFKRLRAATDGCQPSSIEATYTQVHKDSGWEIADTVQYLYRNFSLKPGQVNLSLVNLEAGHPLALKDAFQCWSEYALQVTERMRRKEGFQGDLKLMGLIHRIKNRKPSSECICSAGITWADVSSAGKVYPCLMFTDKNEFYMGRIEDNIFKGQAYKQVIDSFCHPFKLAPPCNQCSARHICNRCAGINHFLTGRIDGHHPAQCKAMQEIMDTLLSGIADNLF